MTSIFFEGAQYREQINQLTSYIDGSMVRVSQNTLGLNLNAHERDIETNTGCPTGNRPDRFLANCN